MTLRLPTPGADSDDWGDILNSFLKVSLYFNSNNPSDSNNGTLNPNAVGSSQLQPNSVATSHIQTNAVTNTQLDTATQTTLAAVANKYVKPTGGIPSTDLTPATQSNLSYAATSIQSINSKTPTSGSLSLGIKDLSDVANATSASNNQVLTYSTSSNQWIPSTVTSSTVSNATSGQAGIVQLAGDMSGSSATPQIVSTHLAAPLPVNQGGTGSNTQNFVDLSTNQTIAGVKTFSNQIQASISGNAATATNASSVSTIPVLSGDVTTNGSNNITKVAKINGITVTGTPSTGQVLQASSTTAASWSNAGTSSSPATNTTQGIIELSNDLAGSASSPQVVSTHLSTPLPLNQGGTGANTQNFVDLSTGQTIAGAKNFTGGLTVNGQSINASPTYQAYKSANYTLQLSDADTIVPFVAGGLCVLTVPTNANVAFPLGTVIYIENTFCTQVNIATQSGVTLAGERIFLPGSTVVMLMKQGTNSWILSSLNNNQRLATNCYYPEDYGLVGGTDDTPAVQAAIDAAAAAGGGTVVLRAQSYTLASSPRTDRGGYSVLALPNTNTGTITFSGVKDLTVLNCNLSGLAYSSTYGVPSVIGGPTPEQNSNNATYKTPWYIAMNGITVNVTNNPTYSGIDLYCCTLATLTDVHVTMSGYGSKPTSVYSFGIRMPGGLNYGKVNMTNILVDGFYFGIVIFQSHTILNQTIANLCYVAYGFISGSDTHATSGTGVQWQECKYGITGYSTSGVVSLTVPFYISIPLVDLEDGETGQWYSSPIHIVDANNMIRGEISYSRTTADIGGDVGPLTVTGAANLTMHDLNATSIYTTPSMSSNWSAVNSVGSTTTLIPLRYKKDRSGLVRVEGTFSKSGASLNSGEVAFTIPAGYRPSAGLYFTTATDTGPGVMKYDGQNPGNFVWISGGTNSSGVGFMTISAIYEGLA
jgi:hypothetical protein